MKTQDATLDRDAPERELGLYATLLAVLVFLMAVIPFLPIAGTELADNLYHRGAWSALFIIGVLIGRERGRAFWPVLVLMFPALFLAWVADFEIGGTIGASRSLIFASFVAILIWLILSSILKSARIGTDEILGAVNAYLLLGVLFMELHLTVIFGDPSAYGIGETTLGSSAEVAKYGLTPSLIYFSFTTLTTLGYGDIQPVSLAARTLCSWEAIIGQLFIAIMVARLVSVYAIEKHGRG